MAKVAVVLSGCGFLDGSEITEAVSSLVCLAENHIDYECFAPDAELVEVNHVKGEGTGATRSILAEAARISRGQIQPLNELTVKNFDGVVFPGGFGVAKNLCDWAVKGSDCEVLLSVKTTLEGFYESKKPICAICIAPALVARVLGQHKISVTIGNDKETAQEIEKTGAQHVNCEVTKCVTDKDNLVVSTPAYMFDDAKPHEVFAGVGAAIKSFKELLN